MGRRLRFTDGFSTVECKGTHGVATTDVLLVDYVPRTPTMDAQTSVTVRDGGEQPRTFYRNVSETATVQCASFDDARIIAGQLHNLFGAARARQQAQTGARVYVEYQPNDNAFDAWRSEILAGRVEYAEQFGRKIIVGYTRRFYWESKTESACNLSNDVSPTPSAQKTIFNMSRTASSRNNYVRLQQVDGDLPTPARIEFYNNYNSGAGVNEIILGHALEHTDMAHIIEMETGTMLANSAVVSNAAFSGGQNVNLAWSGSNEQVVWTAQLTSALLYATAGRWHRLLMPFVGTGSADLQLRARIFSEVISMWDGPWVTPAGASGMIDFGIAQLPSVLAPLSTVLSPLTLEIRAKRNVGGSHSQPGCDFIQITPLQSYRRVKNIGNRLPYLRTLFDDGIDGLLYSDLSTGYLANYVAYGEPAMLVPNEPNTLYFLIDPVEAARSLQIKVFYRARRLTI